MRKIYFFFLAFWLQLSVSMALYSYLLTAFPQSNVLPKTPWQQQPNSFIEVHILTQWPTVQLTMQASICGFIIEQLKMTHWIQL